jgi:DNA-binding GntR family transcriptional regulator
VQELIDQGWVARERGRGTFVQEGSFLGLALLSEHLSLSDQFPPDAVLETTFVHQQITTNEPHCAEALQLPSDEPLLFIRRLRRVNGQPVMVCDSYLPAERFPNLKKSTFVRNSLYATLEEVYGFVIERSERKIAAQEVVDQEVAELLGVPSFSPVLYFTGLTFVEGEDQPIEYMDARVRECVVFTNTVRRSQVARSRRSESALGVRGEVRNA